MALKTLKAVSHTRGSLPIFYKKKEFIEFISDGDFTIALGTMLFENGKPMYDDLAKEHLDDIGIDRKKCETFSIGEPLQTTYRLRQYFNEVHPEIDFDTELETKRPGVFQRFYDKYGFDCDEWIRNKIYSDLEIELSTLGYELSWE